ncbi:MAG: hypothetical protein WA962_12110, partial [Ornithinimicrobium sp.]
HRRPLARRTRGAAACLALAMTLAACSADGDTDADGTAGSSQAEDKQEQDPENQSAQLNDITEPVAVAGQDDASPSSMSVQASQALFASAPAVVVAQSGDAEGIEQASSDAVSLGVPLLLVAAAPSDDAAATAAPDDAATTAAPDDAQQTTAPPPDSTDPSMQFEEIARLGADTVLAVGPNVPSALADLSDAEIVTTTDDIPQVTPPAGLDGLAVLVPGEDSDGFLAAGASAQAAGAQVVPVAGSDVRGDPEAITALADAKPDQVLALGADFGDVETLTNRIDVAKTGVQLPGGGQSLFPGRRLVALYGTPGTPGLGVLGEQDVEASITRAQEMAADFEPYSDVPMVPAFEIIATIAQGSAGADGDYSGEIGVEELRPWVEKAGEEGVYVVLDLQPGRANFLDQAKIYEDLLRMPHVGLALDPEWRLTPTQKPLQQIGQVEAAEVNSVIEWLADLTAEEDLPQKLLVLHQFRLSMLQDEDEIDLSRDELQVLIHMDGQGSPDLKDGTWQSVVGAAPEGVPFGWKNFFDEDEPMLTAEQTMQKEPTPFMISYQ